jgi:hypothetical protein
MDLRLFKIAARIYSAPCDVRRRHQRNGEKTGPSDRPAALLRGADSMFDYRLSTLVGQKTNSHLLRQNLFPALRARGRAEFVRQEGIVIPLDSNKILGVCRNHASAKNTV